MPVMKVGPGRALVGGGGETYDQKVLATGPIAYWPQSETAGLTAHCLVNPLQDGTYTGVTLANDNTGPFGTPAPWYDGATSFNNIYSAALDAAFNEDEHSVGGWAKVANAGVWADGLERYFVCLSWGAFTEYSVLRKAVAASQAQLLHRTNGANQIFLYGTARTDWFFWTMTVNAAANQTRFYIDGAEVLPAAVCAGTVATGLDNNRTLIGARLNVPIQVWHGWTGPVGVWGRVLSPAEVARLFVS